MSFDLKIISGDLRVKNGDLQLVRGEEKLVQDILKISLTTVGANPTQPWYGSYISRTLIGSNLDSDITVDLAKNQLQNALENLKKLQEIQSNQKMQKMTPDEQIAFITKLNVNKNSIDPRLYEVNIQVLTKAFKKVNAGFNLDNSI